MLPLFITLNTVAECRLLTIPLLTLRRFHHNLRRIFYAILRRLLFLLRRRLWPPLCSRFPPPLQIPLPLAAAERRKEGKLGKTWVNRGMDPSQPRVSDPKADAGPFHFNCRNCDIAFNAQSDMSILCSMVAMLRDRHAPECGRCGRAIGIRLKLTSVHMFSIVRCRVEC